MIVAVEKLQDDLVRLEPIVDSAGMKYLFSLMPKYKLDTNDHPSKIKVTLKYGKHFWLGRTESFVGMVRGGVIYLCYMPEYDIWTLDAYRDDQLLRALNRRGNFSYRSGKLVMDWFFKTYRKHLYTVHDLRNRAATLVCRRLGFEEYSQPDTPIGKFILMRKKYNEVEHGRRFF